MEKVKAWLKAHWREAVLGALAAIGLIWYLFIRKASTANNSGTTTSAINGNIPVAGGQAASAANTSQVTSDISSLAQQVIDKMNATSAQNQGALEQQFQQEQAAQTAQESSFSDKIQALMGQLTGAAQAQQDALTARANSLMVALGQAPSGLTTGIATAPTNTQSTATEIANWAAGLGINVQTAAQAVQGLGGNIHNISLQQLDSWLATNHIDPTLSPAANQYKAQQGSGYQPGSAPATASNPAGGGLWKGQTDQQIQQLFQNTYGPNWKAIWTQQHNAGG